MLAVASSRCEAGLELLACCTPGGSADFSAGTDVKLLRGDRGYHHVQTITWKCSPTCLSLSTLSIQDSQRYRLPSTFILYRTIVNGRKYSYKQHTSASPSHMQAI